jgi:hypothetical protein
LILNGGAGDLVAGQQPALLHALPQQRSDADSGGMASRHFADDVFKLAVPKRIAAGILGFNHAVRVKK